ncbi:MAG: ABC transporter permease subunit [Planctomycetota bacterium]
MASEPRASKPDDQPTDLLAARAGAARPTGFFDQPGVRKFMKNKPAVVSLGIIAVFFVAAILIVAGGDSLLRLAGSPVAPANLPGFGIKPDRETRVTHADELLGKVERALEAREPESALADVGFEQYRLVDLETAGGIEAIEAMLEAAYEALDDFDDDLIAYEDVLFERDDVVDDAADEGVEPDAEVLAELDAELLQLDAAVGERLVTLEERVAELYPRPTSLAYEASVLLGTDRQGRSLSLRAVYAIKTAVQIGVVTSVIAVLFGGVLGAAAGYFGGIIDHAVVWLYSTISAIPYLIWLIVIAFVAREYQMPFAFLGLEEGQSLGQTLIPVYAAFILTFWVGPCRVIRGEALKIRGLDYVQSAVSVGASANRILVKHVLPNTAYLLFINFSLLFVGAIKAEVILSFLGLGVQGQPSWGIMIRDSKDEVIAGFFWQIGTATAFMFVLVLAFNTVSDALQDAFDPKHVG